MMQPSSRRPLLTVGGALLGLLWVGSVASGADCNGNGVDDDLDLAAGTSADCNGNGAPDECETRFGFRWAVNPVGTRPTSLVTGDLNGDGLH